MKVLAESFCFYYVGVWNFQTYEDSPHNAHCSFHLHTRWVVLSGNWHWGEGNNCEVVLQFSRPWFEVDILSDSIKLFREILALCKPIKKGAVICFMSIDQIIEPLKSSQLFVYHLFEFILEWWKFVLVWLNISWLLWNFHMKLCFRVCKWEAYDLNSNLTSVSHVMEECM